MLKRSEALPKVKEWIEANFEDKKGGCVAKRDIFDAYVAFCRAHNYQTTNDATFGKIFKTIFPHVQVRRLVRRVKAKKWHYCDVAYRQDSPLAIGAGPALSATAVATDDDDCCSEDGGSEDGGSGTAQRSKAASARCSGRSRGPPKKRKRSTSAAQKKAHLSDDDEEKEVDTNEKKKRRSRRGEEEEEEHDDDEEDGDYVEQQPSSMVQAAEEDEIDGGTPSAGATSIWSDSEDESSSSSSCYASPSLPDTTSKPAAESKHEEDKDLQSSTDTPVCHTPSERAPVPTSLATSTTGLSLGGGDIDLSASSVIRVSSMLHSSSAFPLLAGTSAGLPPFGPATKRRLDDSSELGSEAPPSLTSSSAEMFFSYQPASSTALADFVKAEPREEAEAETEEKPARRHPPTPMMAVSTVDREQIAPHAVAAAPPAIVPAYAHAHHAHTFPAHYPAHESAAAPAEPSPFEASRNLPIHSQTMTSLLLAHGHTTTSTFSMPTSASYAYAPAPQLLHASSTASANQASAFLPGQQQQHYQHGHQHQHHHQYHHQHQHHSHQHQQHQQFSYPPYPIAQHQPPSFVTTASTTHPSWPQPTTGHQTDREMSPESVEIFISHLLTDKSGEVMTLRPQQ